MVEGVDDGLCELAFLAAHGDDDARAVSGGFEHACTCARCRAAIEALQRVLSPSLDAAQPPATVRARLLERVAGVDRHAPFIARVAALFELDESATSELLSSLASPSSRWRPGPTAGTAWLPVASPLRARGVQTLFLRVDGGGSFPTHRHLGAETVLVLEGAFSSSDGARVAAGDSQSMAEGSAHALIVAPGDSCVCAVRVDRGIEVVSSESSGAKEVG